MKTGIIIYQLLLIGLITTIWILLYKDGYLKTFDGCQWGIMIMFSIMALYGVIVLQLIKNASK